MSNIDIKPTLGEGVYTISDCSHILKIPSERLRRWVYNYSKISNPNGLLHWNNEKGIGFNFFTLVEIFVVNTLRQSYKLSMQKIKIARDELKLQFDSEYPFAYHSIFSDKTNILTQLEKGDYLILDKKRQTAFHKIYDPFCTRLDFDSNTNLVSKYWPLGKSKSIIVDPLHSFGRPTIHRTNITTESIYKLHIAGETIETLSYLYNLETIQINNSIEFEKL